MLLKVTRGEALLMVTVGAFLALHLAGCSKKSSSSGTSSEAPSDQGGNANGRGPRWTTVKDFQTLLDDDKHNLKLIGMGMQHYADAWREVLPPAAICDPTGKPLLSWRVAILPYLEYDHVYKEFKLDEPWDSEHNKKLIPKMPTIYHLPGSGDQKDGHTHYRVFVAPANAQGNHPIFTSPPGPTGGKLQNRFKIDSIPDGTSNTILVAESEDPIIWTKPEDLDYDDKKPLPKLGYFWGESTHIVMADGRFKEVRRKVSEQSLRLAITADDGIPLPGDFWE